VGINTFDTANVSVVHDSSFGATIHLGHYKVYSYGESEVVLGKAIKQFNLPRDEIVVMTKASHPECAIPAPAIDLYDKQVYATVGRSPDLKFNGVDPDEVGYVNQHGLSRKVSVCECLESLTDGHHPAYIRIREAQSRAIATELC
jgi:aryl-alcohol dehydrogenase-like predicted oxidoreductase